MAARVTYLRCRILCLCLCLVGQAPGHAQQPAGTTTELTGRVELSGPPSRSADRKASIVVWLSDSAHRAATEPLKPGHFTLVQKNRMFSPHLLVIPVGSVVSFPNQDPFFHNVFSLFNGKRFDLGLYEAGTSKDVEFSREGVSYIFCNIHPEMSAVVITLTTPLFAIAEASRRFTIRNVPPGDYDMHVWIEGIPQPALDRLTRRIHILAGAPNHVVIDATNAPRLPSRHTNKFGKPYDREAGTPY